MTKVVILDYGSGNVRSVRNLFASLGVDVGVSNVPEDLEAATHLVLPGVGAFGASMDKIRERVPIAEVTRQVMERRKPFLGICVGMQVLADSGHEFGEHRGLGWIPGTVSRLETADEPLPHVGWNSVELVRESPLFAGFPADLDFYFVHSFALRATRPEDVAATTEYGERFTSVVVKDNIYGVQFHPEKSQRAGRLLLHNFVALA